MALTTKFFGINTDIHNSTVSYFNSAQSISSSYLFSLYTSGISFSALYQTASLGSYVGFSFFNGGTFTYGYGTTSGYHGYGFGQSSSSTIPLYASSSVGSSVLYTVPSGRTAKLIFNSGGLRSVLMSAISGSSAILGAVSYINGSVNFPLSMGTKLLFGPVSGQYVSTYSMSAGINVAASLYHLTNLYMSLMVNNSNIYSLFHLSQSNAVILSSNFGAATLSSALSAFSFASSLGIRSSAAGFAAPGISLLTSNFPGSSKLSIFLGPGQSIAIHYSLYHSLYITHSLIVNLMGSLFWSNSNPASSISNAVLMTSGTTLGMSMLITLPSYPVVNQLISESMSFITIEESGE